MKIAVRDEILLQAFPCIEEGLNYLNLNYFELHLDNAFQTYNLNSGTKVSLNSDEQLSVFKEGLQERDYHLSALLTDFDISMYPIEQTVAWFKQAINIANELQTKVIRVDSILQQEHLYTFGKKVELYYEVFSEIFAEERGTTIEFGLENHGKEGNNPIFLLSVVNTINDPRFGLTLDFGNFYWRGYPLSETEAILKLLAPYAKYIHIKNIAYPEPVQEVYREAGWEYETYVCPVYKGDINIEVILAELKKCSYKGAICIEDESLHLFSDPNEKKEVLKQDIEFINEITNDIQFDN
ncbi:MAG TPA: TIM barrel protein [Candidatus Hydrogenedens sp.]|nr:TIM barrel protein [Candidatus Hydrogenedens sp.]